MMDQEYFCLGCGAQIQTAYENNRDLFRHQL